MPSGAPILFLFGLGAAATLAAASAHAAPKSAQVTLDKGLPSTLETQVLHALSTSKDPAELEALAAQCEQKGFPLTAAALRARAAQLKALGAAAPGSSGPAPQASNASSTTAPTSLPPLDADIGDLGPAVLTALQTETDPASLIGFAHSIQDKFPLAAAALTARAAALQAALQASHASIAASQGVAPDQSTHATPAAAQTADTPVTANPNVTMVQTPAAQGVVPPATPIGPGSWVLATDADVQKDGVAARYAAMLQQPVGTVATESHNGRTWQLKTISKTTDPSLTTYAKDVKGWIWHAAPGGAAAPVVTPITPAQAPILLPVVTSATMKNSAPSAAVKTLQTNLNALGVASPPLVVDGIPGPKTIAATKSFQAAHGLAVDGIAGPQTQAAIAAALSGAAPAPSPTALNIPNIIIQAGPVSPSSIPPIVTVSDVQSALNQLGYGPLVVDGKAGPKTQAVTKAFQLKAGLTIDGIAGPVTRGALHDALVAQAQPPPAAVSGMSRWRATG